MIGASRASSTRSYQLLSTETITSTGSQDATIPAGTLFMEIEMWGAGGGGAGNVVVNRITYSQNGGAGGAYLKKTYQSSTLQSGDTLTFTVGAGGAGGAATSAGSAGADTTLSSPISLSAGGGGGAATSNAFGVSPPSGGSASGGDTNTSGSDGNGRPSNTVGGDGGDGANGGAGGDGGPASSSSGGGDGTVPGGGGGGAGVGGSLAEREGGDGANGKVIVKYYG